MKPPVSHDIFRERFTQILDRSGLSYAAFARKAGLDRSTLSQLLTGHMPRLPRAETLTMIATTAHVSVDWLLGLSQREEVGSEIIEAVMQIEPYNTNAPAQGSFLDWVKAAEGLRICTVPIGLPDIFKTDEVLRLQYPAAFETKSITPSEAVARRLDMLRKPHQQLELATSRDSILHFALGIGQWQDVPVDVRLRQFDHMIGLVEALYPSLRIYLFDDARAYSVPFTVFGAQRVAVFLGSSFLALNAATHIQMFLSRFDDLIRISAIQPHGAAEAFRQMREMVC
jgi:transcriptional regulator with XRE-family HTH domain